MRGFGEDEPKLTAIIQARMGSVRLPGKTLAMVGEKPMLERVIERVRACPMVQEIIIATTREPRDQVSIGASCNKAISHRASAMVLKIIRK